MKELDFYNNIADWDFSRIKYETENITNWNMYEEIAKHTDKNSFCLDLGTGGGEKVLKKYPEVGMIIATDFSQEMINTAKSNLKGRKKIKFAKMNNLKLDFPNEIFDLVSARHTIINAKEIYRVLEKGGIVVIQGVDKEDCIELKNIFKRGQAYNDEKAISQIDYEDLINNGFEIVKNVKIEENEYFKTKEDLLALLFKTPILDDFSEISYNHEKRYIENELLEKYIRNNKTERGIILKRRLYGIVAKKK